MQLVARPLDRDVPVVSCSFLRDRVTTVGGKQYDLAVGEWVLQAASGNHLAGRNEKWLLSSVMVKPRDQAGPSFFVHPTVQLSLVHHATRNRLWQGQV